LADGWGRVLVTGANGNLGRRLIARLVRSDGEKVTSVCAVVRSERAAASLRELPEAAAAEIEIVDTRDGNALSRVARGARFAVHLPGIIKETRSNSYEDAHEKTCEALALAAARASIERVVYLSILGSDPDSKNRCLASKGRAERILLEAATPAVVLKLPLVLGPGDDTARVVRAEATSRRVPMLGGGQSMTQPIFCNDVVDAILACMTGPGLANRSLDLAGPESLSHRNFIARAARLCGCSPKVLPVPVGLARLLAGLAERLMAEPPLTREMLGVLLHDDCVDVNDVCKELGIQLTPLDEMLRRSLGPKVTTA
jgi:NADH dehydrogenase